MQQQAVVVIHGGAGTIARDTPTEVLADYHMALHEVLTAAQRVLADGGAALDAVSVAVRLLEDCPLFNAGLGSVLTSAGTHELDASIMDGEHLRAGAVSCVRHIRNPVLAARAVLEHGEHVMLTADGAEAFAEAHGLARVEPTYFHTEARHRQWLAARGKGMTFLDHDAASAVRTDVEPIDPDNKFGTVGAVALDLHGHLAAATSTGGVTNKRPGRVGDSPVIGAGCYADDATCAVSATGTGEMFIRTVAAYDVAAQIAYRGVTLEQAAEDVVMRRLPLIEGRGGLIAVDRHGRVAMPFNTEGMYRGVARVGGVPSTSIHH